MTICGGVFAPSMVSPTLTVIKTACRSSCAGRGYAWAVCVAAIATVPAASAMKILRIGLPAIPYFKRKCGFFQTIGAASILRGSKSAWRTMMFMERELLKSIASPALKAVAEHWFSARGEKRMPSWSDLSPKAMAAQLPLVWSLKYDSVTGEFTGRLAGDRIARLIGQGFRGLPLAQAQTPSAFGAMQPILSLVVMEPALYLGGGNIFRYEN